VGNIAVLGFNARLPLKITSYLEEKDRNLKVDELLVNAKLKYENETMKIIGEEFESCARAVLSVINWCVVWDQLKGIPYTLISRAWINRYIFGVLY